MEQALCGLEYPSDANLIVGLERADDAGVYQISSELALIQTVDFFTPIVDDPYDFGQIAVANALSDVYAMGGMPKTAMNLVGFPLKTMDISVLRRVLQGGIDKLKEADVVLAGGHSIENDELFYGLSVTGFVHPEQMLLKRTPVVGDRLILTKPLGTGIVNTAIKAGLADEKTITALTRLMGTLNKRTAEIMQAFPVHACTDITGFGLLGHIAEMIVDTGNSVQIMSDRLPVIPEALEFAAMGLIPAGAYKNLEFRQTMTDIASMIDRALQDILFDPQTSGGLLISVEASHAETLQKELLSKGTPCAAIIGEIVAEPSEKIRVI